MHVLDTARLRLRWFRLDDAPTLLALMNDPDWLRNIGDRGVRTEADARAYLEARILPGYLRDGFGFWAVERAQDGAWIGGCGLFRRASLPDVDVGYALLPRFRSHGYAREAAAACLDHAHRALGLPRVLAIVTPSNAPSIAVLEALGMRLVETRALDAPDDPVHVFAWEPPASSV